MSYLRKNVDLAREELEGRRREQENARRLRLEKAYQKAPRVKEIDRELSRLSMEIMSATLQGKDGLDERLEAIKRRNIALQEERRSVLLASGLGPDFTDMRYFCRECRDTGYVGVKMCSCFKTLLVEKQYASSGIGELLKTQSFESFSLSYYPESYREEMQFILDDLKDYVELFDREKRNLLLVGGTGLGKTHLSTSIAKELIDRGYNVVYDTAQNIFASFENDYFKHRFDNEKPESDKYLECDLLIIDDLGSEMPTKMSVPCLYNILNTRINKGLPIVASTNLSSVEIRRQYEDRITSRLFGGFDIIKLIGTDIRIQKSQE